MSSGSAAVPGLGGGGGVGEVLDAVDETQGEEGAGFGEALEDGAGVDAVAAPGAREAQDVQAAAEGFEKFELGVGEGDGIVDGGPAGSLVFSAVVLEVSAVGQGALEDGVEIEGHGCSYECGTRR